jgi:hypothetical protein
LCVFHLPSFFLKILKRFHAVRLMPLRLPLKFADKMPRGYEPIVEIQEATKKAADSKLIVVVVKGADDNCPNCATAMSNGERAIGSGVVKYFGRAEELNKADVSSYPPALQARVKKQFITGASVTFLVFDPKMEKIVAEASRKELQDNKKLTAEFKNTVKEAKSLLK